MGCATSRPQHEEDHVEDGEVLKPAPLSRGASTRSDATSAPTDQNESSSSEEDEEERTQEDEYWDSELEKKYQGAQARKKEHERRKQERKRKREERRKIKQKKRAEKEQRRRKKEEERIRAIEDAEERAAAIARSKVTNGSIRRRGSGSGGSADSLLEGSVRLKIADKNSRGSDIWADPEIKQALAEKLQNKVKSPRDYHGPPEPQDATKKIAAKRLKVKRSAKLGTKALRGKKRSENAKMVNDYPENVAYVQDEDNFIYDDDTDDDLYGQQLSHDLEAVNSKIRGPKKPLSSDLEKKNKKKKKKGKKAVAGEPSEKDDDERPTSARKQGASKSPRAKKSGSSKATGTKKKAIKSPRKKIKEAEAEEESDNSGSDGSGSIADASVVDPVVEEEEEEYVVDESKRTKLPPMPKLEFPEEILNSSIKLKVVHTGRGTFVDAFVEPVSPTADQEKGMKQHPPNPFNMDEFNKSAAQRKASFIASGEHPMKSALSDDEVEEDVRSWYEMPYPEAKKERSRVTTAKQFLERAERRNSRRRSNVRRRRRMNVTDDDMTEEEAEVNESAGRLVRRKGVQSGTVKRSSSQRQSLNSTWSHVPSKVAMMFRTDSKGNIRRSGSRTSSNNSSRSSSRDASPASRNARAGPEVASLGVGQTRTPQKRNSNKNGDLNSTWSGVPLSSSKKYEHVQSKISTRRSPTPTNRSVSKSPSRSVSRSSSRSSSQNTRKPNAQRSPSASSSQKPPRSKTSSVKKKKTSSAKVPPMDDKEKDRQLRELKSTQEQLEAKLKLMEQEGDLSDSS